MGPDPADVESGPGSGGWDGPHLPGGDGAHPPGEGAARVPDRSGAHLPGELSHLLRLMIVTRPRPACGRPLPRVVEECLEAGATAVELRDEDATAAELHGLAGTLRRVAVRHDALFLVNDRFDVALASGAHGVHLGPEDPPVRRVRDHVPDSFVVGYSTDRSGVARRAAGDGADYLGVGAVYGTTTKPEAGDEAIGAERVGRVLRAAGLPGVGIGGITAENAAEVAAAGAGVAVASAVMDAERPALAVRALLRAIAEGERRRASEPADPYASSDPTGPSGPS